MFSSLFLNALLVVYLRLSCSLLAHVSEGLEIFKLFPIKLIYICFSENTFQGVIAAAAVASGSIVGPNDAWIILVPLCLPAVRVSHWVYKADYPHIFCIVVNGVIVV